MRSFGWVCSCPCFNKRPFLKSRTSQTARTTSTPSLLQALTVCATRYFKPSLSSSEQLSEQNKLYLFALCKMIQITTFTELSEDTRKNSRLCPQSLRGHYRVAPSRTRLLLLVNTASYRHHQQRGNPIAQLTQHTLHAACLLCPGASRQLPLSKGGLGLSGAGLAGTVTGSPPKLHRVPKSAWSHSLLGSE